MARDNSYKIIKGRDLMLFDNDGHAFAFATNHTFSMTAETSDISSKDHGPWGASEVSKFSWEITSENLYTSHDYDSLFDSMIQGEPINIRFGLKVDPADNSQNPADGTYTEDYWVSQDSYYKGKALITSLVANANNGENATYSLTLTGVGSISKQAPQSNDNQDGE